MNLIPSKAPRLLAAPVEYMQRFVDDLTNALRLYFNQIDTLLSTVLGPRGGQYLNNPYAAIQRTTNATFAANTATLVTFNKNDFLNGCTNTGTDGIGVSQSGIYNYQFSVQWANPDTQIHTAWLWLRVNGTDLAGTGSKFDIPSKHGTSDGYLIAACNFYVSLQAGQSVSLYAAVDSALPYMEAYVAQTSPFAAPSIPSIVATLSFVSSLST